MKLRKPTVTRFDKDGETEIIRSGINTGLISLKVNERIKNLHEFVLIAQKGERTLRIQQRKFFNRYSPGSEQLERKYYQYLKAVEYSILDLNRLVEVYHHEFLADVDDNYRIDLLKSPGFFLVKKKLLKFGIDLEKIEGYNHIQELRKIANDLKHSYLQEYGLSKTLKLESYRDFDRKLLVDKLNFYFVCVPSYIVALATEINTKFPRIERKRQ